MRIGLLPLLALIAGLLVFPAEAEVRYVDVNSTNPVAPYTNWAMAATVIQNALDVSGSGDEVVVTNGVYEAGGATWFGGLPTNRVAVRNPIALRSVNGPEVTIIKGYQVPGTTNGTSAVACAHLASGAILSGFTLTNGATLASFGGGEGGGVHCDSSSAVVSNCIIVGNVAYYHGGAAYGGTLRNCSLKGNMAIFSGGGAFQSTLTGCSITSNSVTGGAGSGGGVAQGALDSSVLSGNSAKYGGGAYYSPLNNCTVSINTATSDGGGTYQGALNNCLIISNSAAGVGGGTYYGSLTNCVLLGNSAAVGGGAYNATLINCTVISNSAGVGGGAAFLPPPGCGIQVGNAILYFNTATNGPNVGAPFGGGNSSYSCQMDSCCMMPDWGVRNAITNEPLFTDPAGGNFRLQSNSPCINAGNNIPIAGATDMDGNPRIVGGTVDIGAYEYQALASIISYAWLQQYGLPNNGLADFADPDGDGMNNWQEWLAGTVPTNATSLLRVLSVTGGVSRVTVTWPSVTNRLYFVQRAAGLGLPPNFQTLATNVFSFTNTASYTDTIAAGSGPFFYRVGTHP